MRTWLGFMLIKYFDICGLSRSVRKKYTETWKEDYKETRDCH